MSLSYSITPEINIHKIKKKRCPNGTHKNKKTGECEKKKQNNITKRCPNGTHKNKRTGECEKKKQNNITKRCPNGTRRNKKTGECEKKKQYPRLSPALSLSLSPSPAPTLTPDIPNTKANRIIQNFMLKTAQNRKTNFLKTVCSDSGVCIAFGKETQKIKDYFDGFNTFKNINGIKTIGKPSGNGYVLELQYSKNDYIAHTVLKNALKKKSDNLVYEFFVGQYINEKLKQFPCFLETYGLFERLRPQIHFNIPLKEQLSLLSNKSEQDIIQISCKKSEVISILIQHVSGAKTFGDKIHTLDFNEIICILYQIYMPLMCLQNEFTHYDLHLDNVLLYEPVNGKYIQYHYFVDGNEIKFKSKYIVKIIDYGRCFCHQSDINNSKNIYKKICNERQCNPYCGKYYGYSWLSNDGLTPDNYFINSTEVNVSHDLRLLHEITIKQNLNISPILNNFLSKVQYSIGIRYSKDKRFGTEPNIISGIPNTINNVQDAYWMLESIINHTTSKQENEQLYKNMDELGELFIYADGNKPMEFIPYK